MYGLSYKGKHSYNDFGLIMLSKNRPILPEPKIITEEAAHMDGSFDFSESNPEEETKYKEFNQEIEFNFDRSRINWRDPRAIRQISRSVAAWLAGGEGELVFDDSLDVYYLARVSNKLDLENQIESGRPFTVYFKCRPFAIQRDSTESITLDSWISLDSDIRLDDVYSFDVSGTKTVEVNNFGTHSVKPVIEIVGNFTTISFTLNGKTLTYSEAITGETLIIDNALMIAKKGSSIKNTKLTGDWLTLPAGINSIQISGAGLNCTVTFKFRPLYY
jgi:predicted phage tail component-like protein